MRDSRRISEPGEVRLERVQVIWLTLGGVVALGLVFALGYVVGQRAATFMPAQEAGDPIAQVDAAGDLHDELTFYKELTEPPPAKRPPPRPAVVEAPQEPTAQPASPEPPTVAPPSAEPPGSPESAPAAEPASPAADSAVRFALAAGPAKPGEYTIQVSAYQSMAEARAYAASLERRGFKPFVVTGHVTGRGVWYRVRVGAFPTESAANAGKQLLAQADIPAWVLRTE